MNTIAYAWTPEKVAAVRHDHRSGMTFLQICERLKGQHTREEVADLFWVMATRSDVEACLAANNSASFRRLGVPMVNCRPRRNRS